MVLTPDAPSGDCPECGGYMEEQTTNPVDYSGKCEVYLVCEDCGHETLVGRDNI